MIRRTVQSGLLATIAVFALLPTAAVAADAGSAAPRPVSSITPHATYSLLPAPARHTPYAHKPRKCRHHAKRTARHHRTHMVRRHGTRAAWQYRTHALGHVATRHVPLNVRSGPGTGYRVVGRWHRHALLTLSCKRHGASVLGDRRWYKLAHNKGYVSARYVRTRGAVPWC